MDLLRFAGGRWMMGIKRGLSSGDVLPQIAGRLLSVPVVTAFVALGAVVMVGRGLKDVWSYLRPLPREGMPAVPHAHEQRRAA